MTPVKARSIETRSRPAAAALPPLNVFGIPADRETIFSDHRGNRKARIEKRQRILIAKAASIKSYLHAGERLRCLTTARTAASLVEKLLTGPAFLLFRRSFLIFTDQRILHVPTRFNRTPHSSVSQIAYADLAAMDLKGRTLMVHYKNGRQERFPHVGRPERKKLRMLLNAVPLTPKERSHLAGRVHLCPSCTRPLPGERVCPACKLRFKTGAQAYWRAWLIPGGGYFFSRHPLTGCMMAGIEGLLAVLTAQAWPLFPPPLTASSTMLLWPAAGLLLLKSIAGFHARRLVGERMPVKDIRHKCC